MPFEPRDPQFESRVRASFARQAFMRTLGVVLERVAPGQVELSLTANRELTQQHGFIHAGVVTSVMDSAAGYAALSLMDPGTAVLSVEFKVQLLAPARGSSFRGVGRVIRAGRTLTFVSGEFRALPRDSLREDEVVALLTGTMMTVRERPDLID